MSSYSPDYLRRLLAAVERFESMFEKWMETQEESDHLSARGLFPTAWTKEGADAAKVHERELDVAEAAGAAARAVSVTGSYVMVAGLGAIDPISNWSTMKNPKALLSPQDVRTTTAGVRGRLRALIEEAEQADEGALPPFAPAKLHSVVWAAAAAHWTSHQFRVAVREAAEGLTLHWKVRLGVHDVDDTVFWQQTLSVGEPCLGKPKLVWPGEASSKTVKSMRGGLEPLAKALTNLATGLSLTIRNVGTHTQDELSEQHAMERLSAYSYFARLLDECEICDVEAT